MVLNARPVRPWNMAASLSMSVGMLFIAETMSKITCDSKRKICIVSKMTSSEPLDSLREAVQRHVDREGLTVWSSRVGVPLGQVRGICDGRLSRGDTIIRLCEALGLEFYVGPPREPENASASGLPADTLSDMEAGARVLNRAISNAGGDPIPDDAWPALALHHGAARPLAEGEDTGPGTEPVNVPQSPVHVGTGAGADGWDSDAAHRVWMSRSWMDRLGVVDRSRCIAMKVDDSSMRPTIRRGSLVMVDRARTERRNGHVYAMSCCGGIIVRRVGLKASGQWRFKTDNERWDNEDWHPSAEIIGEVVWTARNVAPLRKELAIKEGRRHVGG